MKTVVYDSRPGVDALGLTERPDPVPGAREVLLAVSYAGINPADINQYRGGRAAPPGAPPDVGGIEVAGTVVALGPGSSRWRIGQRVFGLVDGGGFADRVVAPEEALAAVPDNISEAEAAAAPESFITAHDAITASGGYRPGHRLLVNGGNGGVGSAAVQMGLAWHSEVVATCQSEDGLAFIGSLGARAVARASYLAAGTDELGEFDVILELVGGPNLSHDIELLAMRGRVVVVGTPAGDDASLSLRQLRRRRGGIIGSFLRRRPHEEKAAAVRAFAREVVPLLAAGAVRSYVDSIFPCGKAADAFAHMSSSGKRGNVLLDFSS